MTNTHTHEKCYVNLTAFYIETFFTFTCCHTSFVEQMIGEQITYTKYLHFYPNTKMFCHSKIHLVPFMNTPQSLWIPEYILRLIGQIVNTGLVLIREKLLLFG